MEIETLQALEGIRAVVRRVEDALTSTREELKSHALMLFETLRDDIRVVAEGVVALDSKVNSMGMKVSGLDTKVASLDTKVASLDTKMVSLDAKVESLGSKIAKS
jgi:peptidoglycan hydrolase CwlO-like protein